ncbi:unnamed protein product [Absidia cylindrospora]
MTKATRRSLRSTADNTKSTTAIESTSRSISKTSTKRMVTKKVATPSAHSISDFKQMNGKTLYYVHRDNSEQSTGTWEYEETIEALDVINAFHDRVHSSTGYSAKGNNDLSTATLHAPSEDNEDMAQQQQQANGVECNSRSPKTTWPYFKNACHVTID